MGRWVVRKLLTAPEQSARNSEEKDMGRVSTMFETTEGIRCGSYNTWD